MVNNVSIRLRPTPQNLPARPQGTNFSRITDFQAIIALLVSPGICAGPCRECGAVQSTSWSVGDLRL